MYQTTTAADVKVNEIVSFTWGPTTGRRAAHFVTVVGIERYTVAGRAAVDLLHRTGRLTTMADTSVVVAR